MAYDKQTWIKGEIITAERLNHMENGIGGGDTFTIHVSATGNPGQTTTYSDIAIAEDLSNITKAIDDGKSILIRFSVNTYGTVTDWVINATSIIMPNNYTQHYSISAITEPMFTVASESYVSMVTWKKVSIVINTDGTLDSISATEKSYNLQKNS